MILFDPRPRVLAIGAHPDDIELGAGGLIHRLVRDHEASVRYLVLSAGLQSRDIGMPYQPATRRDESLAAAREIGIAPENVDVRSFPDCSLHEHGHDIIRTIESLAIDAERNPRFDLLRMPSNVYLEAFEVSRAFL